METGRVWSVIKRMGGGGEKNEGNFDEGVKVLFTKIGKFMDKKKRNRSDQIKRSPPPPRTSLMILISIQLFVEVVRSLKKTGARAR